MNNKEKIEVLERVNDNYYKTIDKLSRTMSNISFGSIDDLKTLKNSANEIYNIQKLIEMNVKLQKDLMDKENNFTNNKLFKIENSDDDTFITVEGTTYNFSNLSINNLKNIEDMMINLGYIKM